MPNRRRPSTSFLVLGRHRTSSGASSSALRSVATASVRRPACFSLMVRGEEVGAALAWEVGEGGTGDALRDSCRKRTALSAQRQLATLVDPSPLRRVRSRRATSVVLCPSHTGAVSTSGTSPNNDQLLAR